MIAFVNQKAAPVIVDRPNCPDCGTLLVGWIAHNHTRCPECGKIIEVKWIGRRLVVEGHHGANIDPHSQNS